jgi:hypothetical protein
MPKSVYIETSVISYLAARPSRNLIHAAHQEITHAWWQHRMKYNLFTSGLVRQEASAGDPSASAKRLELLEGLTEIEVTEEAVAFHEVLLRSAGMPAKARVDALHVAVAVVSGLEYLLTWKCAHIANTTVRGKIEEICCTLGYEAPTICTPEEFAGGVGYEIEGSDH